MMAISDEILKSYLDTFQDQAFKRRFKALMTALRQTSNYTPLTPLKYYLDILKTTNEVEIEKMTLEQKIKRKQNLCITCSLLLEDKAQANENKENIERCIRLIDLLTLAADDTQTIKALEFQEGHPDKPVCYTGIFAGFWLGARVLETIDTRVKPVVEWMTSINEKRLYWIWGGGLLRTVLAAIPSDFYNTKGALGVAGAPNQFAGYLSWTLYFARFGLNSFLLLKDTFGPKLREDELKLQSPYWERFKTQWKIRKFTLLNDSIWGIANLVCFFWFKGSDGDLLTSLLLVFDLFIALWDYEEQQTDHLKKMTDFTTQLTSLEAQLKPEGLEQMRADEIVRQINQLKKEKITCQREWDHKKTRLTITAVYALSLMLSFVLMTLPFMPLAATTIALVGLIGYVLCFTLTVIYNATIQGLTVKKNNLTSKEAANDLAEKKNEFLSLIEKDPNLDDNQKILLYLEIKQLEAVTAQQKAKAMYQTMHFVRTVMLQALIPALMFVSFVFLPIGMGFAVLGAVLVIAIFSNLLINEVYKPKQVEFKEFDNEDYEQCCREWKLPSPPVGNQRFFNPNKNADLEKDPQSDGEEMQPTN